MEPFVGEICLFALDFAPKGWLPCQGQILQIKSYQALFALLGNQFGGQFPDTFALPDLRGRVAVGRGQLTVNGQPSGNTLYEVGKTGGAETVTLTAAETPPHAHLLTASADPGSTAAGNGNYLAQPVQSSAALSVTGALYGAPDNNMVPLAAGAMSTVGGGGGHQNMQPFQALTYCIAYQGIWPSRN